MTDEVENVETGDIPIDTPSGASESEMLPKSVVSKIVERERLKASEKAYLKGKQEALMEIQQQQMQQGQVAPMVQESNQSQQISAGIGGMPQLTAADIEALIMQKAPEALMHQVQQLQQKNMVDSFVGKMEAAEQRYPGLGSKLNQLNYNDPRMHKLIEMANGLENTGDIMNELVTNPHKMSAVLGDTLDQPFLALQQLQSLSNSIKQNQAALAEEAQARDPMSQLKPSTNAGMDNGAMSVADFRKMFRRR